MAVERIGLTLALAALLAVPAAAARTGDSEQPIEIEADDFELDSNSGISVYRGDVVIRQGSLEIRADRATVTTVDGEAQSVVIDGGPDGGRATFRQEEDDGSVSNGRARSIEYAADLDRIRLSGDAWVRQGASELAGEVIDYDLETDVARAAAGGQGEDAAPGGGRVRIVIERTADEATPTDGGDEDGGGREP